MHRTSKWRWSGGQVILARWLLALVIISGLTLNGSAPLRTVRAQATEAVGEPDGPATIPAARGYEDRSVPPLPFATDDADVDDDVDVYDAADEAPVTARCSPEQASSSFKSADRLVMTYYYYWYDPASLDDPALTSARRPIRRSIGTTSPGTSASLPTWPIAGVDVALAVYWGTRPVLVMPGLDKMVEARERLLAAGLARPPSASSSTPTPTPPSCPSARSSPTSPPTTGWRCSPIRSAASSATSRPATARGSTAGR